MKSLRELLTNKYALASCVTGSIVTANLTASKVAFFDIPLVGGAAIPAGFLALGVAFLASDLLSELHGKEVAHSVVTSAVGMLAVVYALVYASVAMPAAPFYNNAESFTTIMTASAPIIGASLITTGISQNLDVTIFHAFRDATGSGHKWLRNVGSTVISQAVDTTLFIGLAFVLLPILMGADALPLSAAAVMVGMQYLLKVIVALGDTPLFYVLTGE